MVVDLRQRQLLAELVTLAAVGVEVDRLRVQERLVEPVEFQSDGVAVVLMIGAGLTLVSLLRLYRVDAGFPTDHLLVVQLRTGGGVSPSGPNMAMIYQALRHTLGEIPGVRSVGAAKALPMARHQQPIETQLWRNRASGTVAGEWTVIVPGLFETLELPVLAGRSLQPVDDVEARSVAMINEALAVRLFGSALEAVGRPIQTSGAIKQTTVVGVVRNVTSPMHDVVPTLYVPASNTLARLGITLALRVATTPAAVAPRVRQAIRTAYPEMTVVNATALTDDIAETMRYPRFLALLLNTFGAMGLLIAASGIHGIAAYAVTRRRYEVGVRMAFGADPRSIVQMLVGRAAVHVAVGTALGVMAAALLGRVLTGALYGVSASNLAVFASVAAISLAVGLASYVPSRRAAMIPLGTLLRE